MTHPHNGLARKAVATTMLALALVGCTSDKKGSDASDAASASHLTKVLKSKSLRVAVQRGPSPWSTLKATGEYEGFDIDMAKALADSLGAKVEWVEATNETRIPLLQTDKADVVIASFSNTNVRAQQVEMTKPYQTVSNIFLVPKGSAVRAYNDLAGKTVSASRGSAGEAILAKQFPEAKVTLFASYSDALQALKSNKVDALLEADVILKAVAASDPNLQVLEGPTLNSVNISMGVKQGDQIWLNYLNNFVMNFSLNGANEATSQKWLHKPASPYIK